MTKDERAAKIRAMVDQAQSDHYGEPLELFPFEETATAISDAVGVPIVVFAVAQANGGSKLIAYEIHFSGGP